MDYRMLQKVEFSLNEDFKGKCISKIILKSKRQITFEFTDGSLVSLQTDESDNLLHIISSAVASDKTPKDL